MEGQARTPRRAIVPHSQDLAVLLQRQRLEPAAHLRIRGAACQTPRQPREQPLLFRLRADDRGDVV